MLISLMRTYHFAKTPSKSSSQISSVSLYLNALNKGVSEVELQCSLLTIALCNAVSMPVCIHTNEIAIPIIWITL